VSDIIVISVLKNNIQVTFNVNPFNTIFYLVNIYIVHHCCSNAIIQREA